MSNCRGQAFGVFEISCCEGIERRRGGLALALRWLCEYPKELQGFGLRGTSSGDFLLTPLFVDEPDLVVAV